MRLYKYMRALDSTICSEKELCNQQKKTKISDQLRKMLSGSRIYLSDPLKFNDPFDGYYSLKFSSDEEKKEAERKVNSHLLQLIEEKKMTQEEAEKWKKDVFTQIPFQNYRVSCFAKNDENDLMWAHYADCHQGVCLVYEIGENDIITENNCIIFVDNQVENEYAYFGAKDVKIILDEVIYTQEKPYLEFKNGKTTKPYDTVVPMYTKSEIWQYEKELRMVAQLPLEKAFGDGMYFCRIDKRCLKEIRFGLRLEEKYQKKLIKIIEDSGYEKVLLYKAEVDPFKLKLEFVRI